MNLKTMTDELLFKNTSALVKEERENLVRLLYHLSEIDRRRLFSDFKFSSLHDYMITELKYSSDDAVRRISAMRLLREFPELEESIKSGALSMTNLNLAQTLFTKELKAGRRYSLEQKREVLYQFVNKSTRNAKKVAGEINPAMKQRELTFDSIDDDLLREKLLRLKGLLAHRNPYISLAELLHKICDLAITEKTKSPAAPRVDSEAQVYREVWRRDGGKCTNCGSFHALEYDHVQPKAAGGATTVENLRLLCRKCNQRAAIAFYGRRKMNKHINSPYLPYVSERKFMA